MYITKTLAVPKLNESDCMKIIDLTEYDGESIVYGTLKDIIQFADFDITDDELLAHICVRRGLFTYKDWQTLINRRIKEVSEIDYEVDSTKRRLTLTETVYQMSGKCGRVLAGGYQMISALTGRDLVFSNIEKFEKLFGTHPQDYIIRIWQELDTLLHNGIIIGEYTIELLFMKYPKKNENKS